MLILLAAAGCAVVAAQVALSGDPAREALPASARADRLLVEKAAHRLTLLAAGRTLRSYEVALGRGGLAAKTRQGDNLTPEGIYRIDWRNPHSAFHLALHISYPAPRDVERAAARGEAPGGAIMIHGLPNGMGAVGERHRLFDWTAGCIAVTDAEIEEIWRAVPDGTAIEIRP